jgi:hypothetical protein
VADLSPISYLTKDYEGFRSDMLKLIPSIIPEWTDTSDSDPGVVILELLANGLDILSYYQDRQGNESSLPTATQRQSVIDACKLISYRLKTATPSTSTVVFTITPQTIDYKVPAGFQIATQPTPYSPSIVFETNQDLIIPAGATGTERDGSGNYLYSVDVTQGVTISNEILGSSNNAPNQTYTLKNANVIIDGAQGSSLKIYVNGGSGPELWVDVTDALNPYTSSGKQYSWTIDASGFLTVQFGDGSSGAIPASGTNNLSATYRIGGGVGTNVGVGTINTLITSSLVIRGVTNITAASGGIDKETIEHAKQQAPLSLRTANRAVTRQDYITLAKNITGVEFAQATTDAGTPNTVFLTVAPVGGGNPTTDLMNQVYNYVNDLKMITTNIIMSNPKYLGAQITLNVTVGPTVSMGQTRATLQQALNSILGFGAMDFEQPQYLSYLYQVLNSTTGVQFLSIDRFTVNPRVDAFQNTGNPTWSAVTVKPANTYDGLWKVTMTSATAFKVEYNPLGDGTTWVLDGTGSFGTTYNSVTSGAQISFTITSGTIAAGVGDNWKFRTSKYLGNITVNSDEILLLDSDVVINISGGIT